VAGRLDALDRLATKVAPLEEELVGAVRGRPLDENGLLRAEAREARATVRRWAAAEGIYQLHLPESIGGGGFSRSEMFFVEERAYREGFSLLKDAVAWTEGPSPAVAAATAEQRERFVEPLMQGETTACCAITEPDAGSDLLGMRTTARRSRGHWVLEGRKALITWAPFADVAVVIARTGEERSTRALTAFFVPADTDGYHRDRLNRTIMDDGVTGELVFDGCRVPNEFVLGEVGQGFHVAMAFINWRRVCRAGMCAGLARYLFDKTLRYSKERISFGRPLGSRQFIQFLIADLYVEIERMRATSLELLKRIDTLDVWRLDRVPEAAIRYISTVKLLNDEALFTIADRALQAHGGWGMVSETGVEQVFRVARNLRVPAGTTEMQRLSIAQSFGLHDDMTSATSS
jgi:acyl-CoA dehydrogenase